MYFGFDNEDAVSNCVNACKSSDCSNIPACQHSNCNSNSGYCYCMAFCPTDKYSTFFDCSMGPPEGICPSGDTPVPVILKKVSPPVPNAPKYSATAPKTQYNYIWIMLTVLVLLLIITIIFKKKKSS